MPRERRALAEARPVVDHRQARRAAVGDRVPGAALVIERHDRHEMREQRAGAVELAAVDDDVVAGVDEGGLEVDRALRAELGEGVAEAGARQHLGEQELLLRLVGHGADRGDDAEVVLRDLPDGWNRPPR